MDAWMSIVSNDIRGELRYNITVQESGGILVVEAEVPEDDDYFFDGIELNLPRTMTLGCNVARVGEGWEMYFCQEHRLLHRFECVEQLGQMVVCVCHEDFVSGFEVGFHFVLKIVAPAFDAVLEEH